MNTKARFSMLGYSRDMQRYVRAAGYQGVGGFFDWIGQIFAPGITSAEKMAEDIKKAEAERAAAAAAATTQPTADVQARLAAAEAALEQLKLQQRSTDVVRPAGISWLTVAALGAGAYFLFRGKPARAARRRAIARRPKRTGRRRRRR